MSFDANSVRDAWDRAADSYADGQAAGLDHYRYEFFGPAHADACGEVKHLRLLDAGCGSGYFSRLMAERGAAVVGTDISPRMIARAEEIEAAARLGIAYKAVDAAELSSAFDRESFDVVTSCMALQDMPQPAAVFKNVREILRPGGRFVFSIEHPCSNPPFRKWERTATGEKRWLCIDRYFDRGPREYTWTRWPKAFTTTANHAPLEDWFDWILSAGFSVHRLLEPKPTDPAILRRPSLSDASRVPYFLILDVR